MLNELSREEINALIDVNRGILDSVQKEMEELKKKSFSIAMRIRTLSELRTNDEMAKIETKNLTEIFEGVYSRQWTLVKKVEFILTHVAKKISTTREIADAIKRREESASVTGGKILQESRDISGRLHVGAEANDKSYSSHINEEHIRVNEDEPLLLHEVDIADLVSKLGATLKQKVDKKDTFARIEIEGVWYYGLVDWFDGKKVKQNYIK